MLVDCDRCVVRGDACRDCVITLLLGSPPGGVELDAVERTALDNLAAVGQVPELRLVDRDHDHSAEGDSAVTATRLTEVAVDDVQRSARCGERSHWQVS